MARSEQRSGARGSGARTGSGSRRRSRELALQALYEWLVTGHEADALLRRASEDPEHARSDKPHLDTLVHGVLERAGDLNGGLQPFLDRPAQSLSPVEHALLLIGAFELTACPDIPYRVDINEAVELAKSYGGTDGHKYVNGVLDKLAAQVRPAEARKT
jgi:transcription antitermination protein NusB